MESTGKARLRECQIEQERRYERARRDIAATEQRERTKKCPGMRYRPIPLGAREITWHDTIHTDTTGMKRIRRIK